MAVAIQPKTSLCGRRLGAFITASIAVHSLLLAGWLQDDHALPAASRLAVTMIANDRTDRAATETPARPAATPHTQTPTKRVVGPREAATTAPVNHTTVADVTTNPGPVARQTPKQPTDSQQAPVTDAMITEPAVATHVATADKPVFLLGQIKARVDERLSSDFARHFHYPYLAQRRNWQGEVRLGLRIEASGHLSHIHIIKSSGYAILDQAALDSLKKVATIPGADHWLQGNTFDTVLPVEYRLIDS